MRIYLDCQATTPLDPRVLEAMLPFLRERFGNASSAHAYGWEAEEAVEQARRQVAALLGADGREVFFTSGATEANNLALLGAAGALAGRGRRMLVSPLEHPSVTEAAHHLAGRGFEVGFLPVDSSGCIAPAAVEEALTDDTVLVAVQAANHEIGTLQPTAEIGRRLAERGIWLHVDATQAVGKVPFDVAGASSAALSAHKLYGPKGCGALWVRRDLAPLPMLFGGGQERGLRPGTLNVPGIVGLGCACALARAARTEEAAETGALRDRFLAVLRERAEPLEVNGAMGGRLPGNLSVILPGVESVDLLAAAPEIAFSSGAACASGSLDPSPVLLAIGRTRAQARCAARFGFGRFTTEEEVDRAAAAIAGAVARLRGRTGRAKPGRRRRG